MPETLYDMLGLEPTDDTTSIEAAYRTACAVSGGPHSVPKNILLAYRVLAAPEKRSVYNQLLEADSEHEGDAVPEPTARILKLCADEWGFEWHDGEQGTRFRHVGVSQIADQHTRQTIVPAPPEPVRHHKFEDYVEQPTPRSSWKPSPIALGDRVFHFRKFVFRVTDAVYTSSHLELHLDDGEQIIGRFPELLEYRGIRPGCEILMCGMGNLAERDWFYFTGACIWPYEGTQTPELASIDGIVNHWFDAAKRGLSPTKARKPVDFRTFCLRNFGVEARNKREYERLISEYELRTWEALIRFSNDWLGFEQASDATVRLYRRLAEQSLKSQWGIKRLVA